MQPPTDVRPELPPLSRLLPGARESAVRDSLYLPYISPISPRYLPYISQADLLGAINNFCAATPDADGCALTDLEQLPLRLTG